MGKRISNAKIIAVIGGRTAKRAALKEAEKAGELIAASGAMLLSGGLGGVMKAASRGAHKAGGLVIGVLPHEHKRSANPYVDVPIATGLGIGRNIIIARTADGLIAVGGQYGTLSEIAFALQLKKPVVAIGSWDIEGVVAAEGAEEAVAALLQRLG